MSEELSPMDRMELWMSAINEAIANGTDTTYTPYDRHELWMKKIIESILAKDPADPAVVEEFVNDWLDDHPEATTTVEDGAVTRAKLADAALADIAAEYSSSATYAVGDYVFHSGALYRCVSAITTAEAWTAAHWTQVALADDVVDLKSAIDFQIVTSNFELSNWRNGYVGISGNIGNDTQGLISGYNGATLTMLGDGNTYGVTMASGWKLHRVAEYSGTTTGTFEKKFDQPNSVTLLNNKYYVFYIIKDPIANVSPSDVAEDTIVLTHTEYESGEINRLDSKFENVYSTNLLNPADIEAHTGHTCLTSGVIGTASEYSYTDYIPVSAGDVLYAALDGMIDNDAWMLYVCSYDSSKTVMPNDGMGSFGREFTIPSGVSFVRVTIKLSQYETGKLSINLNRREPYEPYYVENRAIGISENKQNISSLMNFPLSTMPDYIVSDLAYRPLKSLSKGYFCFVTDDGHADMVTYTIPMCISKNIPCTFAVMKASACFATQEQTDVVLDAVENHGCAIAQHGGRNWTEFTEYGLNKFFETEKEFWDDLGVTVKSAVIPSHYTTKLIQAIAGGRFGVVRSGGKGYDAQGNWGDTIHNYYDYYTSGEGSNLFGLSSYNITTQTLETNKAAIDYAYANNKIMIVYIHENSLDADKKTVLEGAIDYAKTKGLTFITLDKIPYLEEGSIVF